MIVERYAINMKFSSTLIKSFELNDSENSVEVIPNDTGSTNLYIEFERQGRAYGNKLFKNRIKLYVETDTSNLIVKCRAFSSGESNIWERTEADINNIFFSDGSVLINTTVPFVGLEDATTESFFALTQKGRLGIYDDQHTGVVVSAYGEEVHDASLITLQSARGTRETSEATKSGDRLGALLFRGHAGTFHGEKGFGRRAAEIGSYAAQNFSSTSKSADLYFATAPLGTPINDPTPERMRITSEGKIGIGITEPETILHIKHQHPSISFTDTTTNALSQLSANSEYGSIGLFADQNNLKEKSRVNFWVDGLLEMSINSTGLAIGNTPNGPASKRLDVRGDTILNGEVTILGKTIISGKTTINNNLKVFGTISTASDSTLKDNIIPIKEPIDKIKRIKGVTFDWNDKSRGKSVGIIAQDVQKVFPQLVETDENKKLTVNYDGLVGLLIEVSKEQQLTIAQQQTVIKKQEERLAKIEAILNIKRK
jgi:hypothetical protein